MLAALVQLATCVWFFSGLDKRVTAIEAQMQPGVIQRLDERTLDIQHTLERLEARP